MDTESLSFETDVIALRDTVGKRWPNPFGTIWRVTTLWGQTFGAFYGMIEDPWAHNLGSYEVVILSKNSRRTYSSLPDVPSKPERMQTSPDWVRQPRGEPWDLEYTAPGSFLAQLRPDDRAKHMCALLIPIPKEPEGIESRPDSPSLPHSDKNRKVIE